MTSPSTVSTPDPWWRNDAVIFAVLVAIAAIAFGATYAVSASYVRREDSLARHWYQLGDSDLTAGNPKSAVSDFRTALLYSRDNPRYRLRLAQALAADNDVPQAIAYFLNLWEGQPGSGLYNLELARLYARDRQPRSAMQFYNNAIYGAWVTDPGAQRRAARVEYIKFLMQQNQAAEAQAQAIALASVTPPTDIEGRLNAANLLLTAGDPQHALDEFSALLKEAPAQASLGAGRAAFQLGRFRTAADRLHIAIEHGNTDPLAKGLLTQSQSILDLDPWQRGLTADERAHRVSTAYVQAGSRLQQCSIAKQQPLDATPPTTDLQLLYSAWTKAGTQLHRLPHDPDLRDSLMDLAFRIEGTTAVDCGPSTGATDQALTMLSRYGEAVQQ